MSHQSAYVVLLAICTSIRTIACIDAGPRDVSLVVEGLTARMDNGLIQISFESDATVSSLYKNGKDLVANVGKKCSFYIDWNNKRTSHFAPSRLVVISRHASRAHIMYLQDDAEFVKIEYHVIMEKGLSGIYSYVKLTNNKHNPISFGLMRVVYRFDPTVMDWVTNGVQQAILPRKYDLEKSQIVQDTTWKFDNGTIYSKYDFAGYIRNTHYQGVFGHGHGAWLISASREYHSGGPLKQDLMVHHEALILNCLTASHFGTPVLVAPAGWSKLYGPWLLYFNTGSNEKVKENAVRQSNIEQSRWPYKWMNELDYPLKRGSLMGKIKGPCRSMVVLSSSLSEKFDLQVLGYSYSIETDKKGRFKLKNIIPGKYKATIYPVTGFGIGYQKERRIKITEGTNRFSVRLRVPTKVKWAIGETNRRSDAYRYSNKERNYIWHLRPPANLTFQIGKDKIDHDWYYAQTHKGTWTIRYRDIPDRRHRTLRIGLAAASNNELGSPLLAVSVNGHLIKEFHYENDHSIYRSAAQSGNYYAETLKIPAKMIKRGDNVIDLSLRHGAVMYDSINLS